jgi:hypothetical protein
MYMCMYMCKCMASKCQNNKIDFFKDVKQYRHFHIMASLIEKMYLAKLKALILTYMTKTFYVTV